MANAKLNEWRMACQGKVAFPSRFAATKTIQRRPPGKRFPLRPYLCKNCNKWHLGAR